MITDVKGLSAMTAQAIRKPDHDERIFDAFAWINKHACCFKVDGNKVKVLRSPNEFYNNLMVCMSKAVCYFPIFGLLLFLQ